MKIHVSDIQLIEGDIWASVVFAEEVANELGTYMSCEVKVSLKKSDFKLSEINELAIEKAKSFLALAIEK